MNEMKMLERIKERRENKIQERLVNLSDDISVFLYTFDFRGFCSRYESYSEGYEDIKTKILQRKPNEIFCKDVKTEVPLEEGFKIVIRENQSIAVPEAKRLLKEITKLH